jgi:HEPN domain-containing protein
MEESFTNSASRHLQDARTLLKLGRWDNAVYLAGYVVECAFKVLVQQYFDTDRSAAKKYGHDLTALDGIAMERLRVIYPILDRQLPATKLDETVLAKYHPERRYARSGLWGEDEARLAIDRATEIYRDVIIKLVLNGIIDIKDIRPND